MAQTQAAVKTGIIKGIDLAAFLVRDPQKATAFYRDVLGMVPTGVDDEGRGAEFELPDGSTFGVWKPEGGETGGTMMFAVDDCAAAVAEFRSRGLELSEPMDTPVCKMAFGKDPEGNGIIIHQRTVKD
ncbi:MAG: VOC family protein [Candidatus Eremiobacteraeota bacterium]|nr:VOC family protein [Candidatus Eremiobacteraeota bacterium]